MAASWHFNVDNNGVVHLQARFEGYDGTVGDAHDVVEPGGNFHNLTYEQLKRAGGNDQGQSRRLPDDDERSAGLITSCDRRAGDAVDRMAAGRVIRVCPPIRPTKEGRKFCAGIIGLRGPGRLLSRSQKITHVARSPIKACR